MEVKNNVELEFIEATKRWYEYVILDHHKDRDCHWHVDREKVFSYGEPSEEVDGYRYKLYHDGYIIDGVEFYGNTEEEVFKQGIAFINDFIENDSYSKDD